MADASNPQLARAIWLMANGRTDKNLIINLPGGGARGARIPVEPVGGAPLRSGAVVDTFMEGPQNFAIERYQLNGAEPNAHYDVRLAITIGGQQCEGPPIFQPSVGVDTNAAGNGESSIRVPPEFIPPIAFDKINSLFWEFVRDGNVRYRTACTPIFEDLPT
jgi:hypothetical protein